MSGNVQPFHTSTAWVHTGNLHKPILNLRYTAALDVICCPDAAGVASSGWFTAVNWVGTWAEALCSTGTAYCQSGVYIRLYFVLHSQRSTKAGVWKWVRVAHGDCVGVCCMVHPWLLECTAVVAPTCIAIPVILPARAHATICR